MRIQNALLTIIYMLPMMVVVAEEPVKVALVLGGGGARGAAHIGVLEVLERERIPIDCIVGTSMGALVAGSYVSGLSPEQMRERLSEADWTDIFLDTSDFSQLSYRKKKVSKGYLSATEMGVTKKGFQLRSGLVAGEKIKLFFNRLVSSNFDERRIENLPIPVAIVATDIGSGERVVFREGSLSQAMRASMSVPGFMSPVDYQGRKLVDGGLVDNLPIQLGRELCGANRVIAVNVESPLADSQKVNSLIDVTAQMIGILTNQNVTRSQSLLIESDVYLQPDLGNIKATEFTRYDEAADQGKLAAENQLAKLRQLSVDEDTYSTWKKHKKIQNEKNVIIDEIRIAPMNRVHPDFVARQIHQRPGMALDREMLDQDLIRAYGDGFYSGIDYQLISGEKNVLQINAIEKNSSSDYIAFGFLIDNEYQQGSHFDFRTAYRSTWLNSLGGEIFAALDLGSRPKLELDYYQPLDSRHRFFIEPNYYRHRETINFFIEDDQISEYKLDTRYSELALGINLRSFGQTKLGWREYTAKGEAEVSAIPLGNIYQKFGGFIYELNLDRRNRLYFPSSGWQTNVGYFDAAENDYNKLAIDFNAANRIDKFVLGIHTNYTTSLKGILPVYDAVKLGGFLKMSGYVSNQILGDEAFYGQLRLERIVGHMPLGINGDLRLGFGLEGARLGTNYTMDIEGRWMDSGVVYLGGETPLGPLYLGYGFTSSGDYNFYFQLGDF